MKRKDLWITPYNEFMDKIRRTGFNWDEIDCGPRFVGALCEALTGVNPAAHLVGLYHDEASAVAVMQELGFNNLADATASLLPEYDNPAMAQMGDVAAILDESSPFGYALGIVNGERIFVLGKKGVGVVNRRHMKRAFKVG
ncbi:hypothetical protein [Rhizobium phage RHph_X3_2]|nr:hypothetical protein [Rhizobium phage RHph_X3_2]